jgi:hypothetical protein
MVVVFLSMVMLDRVTEFEKRVTIPEIQLFPGIAVTFKSQDAGQESPPSRGVSTLKSDKNSLLLLPLGRDHLDFALSF